MNLAVISASTQANSESRRLADYFTGRLKQLSQPAAVIDLHELGLPLFGTSDLDRSVANKLEAAKKTLESSAGAVLVTPEWNGGPAPGWNNFVIFIGDCLAHKPLLVVGVSAGRGGAYPLLGVRASGYKNSRYVVIPESLIISNCGQFQPMSDDPGPETKALVSRSDYALAVLIEYAQALVGVRQSQVIDHDTYPSGI